MAEVLYPVLSLNQNITEFLKKVISADILGSVQSGLKNDVELTDKGTHITGVASIEKSIDGKSSVVRLSSAYCQYFWLLCDVVLKILDRMVIADLVSIMVFLWRIFLKGLKKLIKKQRKRFYHTFLISSNLKLRGIWHI